MRPARLLSTGSSFIRARPCAPSQALHGRHMIVTTQTLRGVKGSRESFTCEHVPDSRSRRSKGSVKVTRSRRRSRESFVHHPLLFMNRVVASKNGIRCCRVSGETIHGPDACLVRVKTYLFKNAIAAVIDCTIRLRGAAGANGGFLLNGGGRSTSTWATSNTLLLRNAARR